MKFLYFGDKHERATAPENRTENDTQYIQTQMEKTKEIIEIGKKFGVSGFLQPGDFLDSPNPPLHYVADVMRLWTGDDTSEDIENFENKMPPLIGIVGNHELYGNNLKTLPKTMIGFLGKLGMMHFATKQKPFFFTTEDGAKVAITGTHYHLDIDSPEYLDDYVVEEKLGDFHIHMVHGYLTDKSKGNLFPHTIIDHIKHTKADLTISGHDHIGFPLTEIDGKFFVNPGAIPRMSNDLKEIKRIPKVMLIDITKTNGIQLKMIPLKSAQKGDVILNRQKIVERKKREGRLEEYKKTVREADVKKSTDITEIIRNLANSKGLPLHIRDDVIDRISMKQKDLDSSHQSIVKEAYVNKIILENFQAHAYTELEFSKGLNILVGESRQGKTSILRGFKWVYTNKPSGKRIIKTGSDYARVTVYLSSGYIISRYIERKANGKNGYFITDPVSGVEEFHNTKILPEVQRILGFTPFIIDNDLQFNLNFMEQGKGWFLIGDEYSAPVKAKIIGGIYGTQYTDAVSRELDAEEKKVNESIRDIQGDLKKVDENIESYGHLPQLEKTIVIIDKLLKDIDALKARKEKIVSLIKKRKQIEEVIQENDHIITQMKDLDRASLFLEQSKLQVMKRSQLFNALTNRKTVEVKYHMLVDSLQALKNIDKAKDLFESLQSLFRQSENIRQVLYKRKRIVNQLTEDQNVVIQTIQVEKAINMLQLFKDSLVQRKELSEKAEKAKRLESARKEVSHKLQMLKESLEKTEKITKARKLVDDLRVRMDKKEKLCTLLEVRKRINHQIEVENITIKKQNQETAILLKEYKEILEQAGSCPVCHGKLNERTVERIVNEYIAS
ncbi:metallophosphoesterase (plasmid) [Paenibacillus thiaminolyticus]|uniref:metallophosphoesterase n=1 Tax=Paenibacillus thiaminolyticus TaxID=49283 RepID=UPI00232B17F5|nr:metallophosphoesterase [Paenibacillus thiaminolyticus]WCF11398.1 metallophosphoesterase [Paenibacillus thiaminolyticus]